MINIVLFYLEAVSRGDEKIESGWGRGSVHFLYGVMKKVLDVVMTDGCATPRARFNHPELCSQNGSDGKLYVRHLRRSSFAGAAKRGWGAASVPGLCLPFCFKRTVSIFRYFTQRLVGVGSTPSCPPVSQKHTWKPSKLFKV